MSTFHRDSNFAIGHFFRATGDGRELLLVVDGDNGVTASTDLARFVVNKAGTYTLVGNLSVDGKLHFVGAQLTGLSTGIAHVDSSGNITSSAISLTVDVTGTLAIANGGTNAVTASAALANLGGMGTWVTAPVSHASPGTAGQLAYDGAGNLYVCYGTNQWAKFAPSSIIF